MLVDLQEQFHTPFYRHLLLASDKHEQEYSKLSRRDGSRLSIF